MTDESKIRKDEERAASIPRPSLQTLSDLIFGLALSIGALVLLGQPPADFVQMIVSLSVFAFGFYLLVTVWYRYASIMKILPFETSWLLTINLLLLFLVAIEPYLLNIMVSGSSGVSAQSIEAPVSQLYAFDFGSIYVILAYFMHELVIQEKETHKINTIRLYANRRVFFLIVAAVFYISIVPFFGGVTVSYFSFRQLMWLSFLPIGVVFRIAGWLG